MAKKHNKPSKKESFSRERLREILKYKKMTYADLAAGTDIVFETLHTAITSKKIMPYDLDKIGKYLNVAPEYRAGKVEKLPRWGDDSLSDFELIPEYVYHENRGKSTTDLTLQFIRLCGYTPGYNAKLANIPDIEIAQLSMKLSKIVAQHMEEYINTSPAEEK